MKKPPHGRESFVARLAALGVMQFMSAMLDGVAVKLSSIIPSSPLAWYVVKRAIRLRFPASRHISASELESWLKGKEPVKPLLLDVRAPEETALSHLATAHFTYSKKQTLRLLSSLKKNSPIVVYCSIGHRAASLVTRLRAQGYNKVFNLEGGIFEWANNDRPVYRGKLRVNVVHPYDNKWGKLLNQKLWPQEDKAANE